MTEYTLHLTAIELNQNFDIDVIAEICFAINRRVLSYYGTLLRHNNLILESVGNYLHQLHTYLLSMGMVTFLDETIPNKMEIQQITLFYRVREAEIPVSFQGVTTFGSIMRGHPKMALDFLESATNKCIQAIHTKLRIDESRSEYYARSVKNLCDEISRTREVSRLLVHHPGTPLAILRIKLRESQA